MADEQKQEPGEVTSATDGTEARAEAASDAAAKERDSDTAAKERDADAAEEKLAQQASLLALITLTAAEERVHQERVHQERLHQQRQDRQTEAMTEEESEQWRRRLGSRTAVKELTRLTLLVAEPGEEIIAARERVWPSFDARIVKADTTEGDMVFAANLRELKRYISEQKLHQERLDRGEVCDLPDQEPSDQHDTEHQSSDVEHYPRIAMARAKAETALVRYIESLESCILIEVEAKVKAEAKVEAKAKAQEALAILRSGLGWLEPVARNARDGLLRPKTPCLRGKIGHPC